MARAAAPEPKAIDLSSVESKLSSLASTVATLKSTDVSGLESRLAAVQSALSNLRLPEPVDLTALEQRLSTTTQKVDLSGVEARLEAVERVLSARTAAVVAPAPAPAPAPAARPPAPARTRAPGSNLLTSPRHGKPDDLKEIVGVAEKLERLLHRNGVYYFWQIADWSRADVRYVDSKLEVFKGRIDRDEWVRQCRRLARLPTRRPGLHRRRRRAPDGRPLGGAQASSAGSPALRVGWRPAGGVSPGC